jgi:hypothetical protein
MSHYSFECIAILIDALGHRDLGSQPRCAGHTRIKRPGSDKELVLSGAKLEDAIMVRKLVIALAATAAIIAGSAFDASARMSGVGHSSGIGRGGPSGFARMSPGLSRAAIGHPRSFAGIGLARPRIALRHHHRFHNRFFAFAGAFPYGYYDGCYERIWTRWGWRLIDVCGPY